MSSFDGITILPMTGDHLDEVVAIEADSFPRPWTRDHFTAELDSPRSICLIACAPDGCVAGYICTMLVLDEGEILDVAVRRDFRGQGVGGMLLARAITDLKARGGRTLSLEVRVSNASAIALYRRFGFVETGLRKRYYENGEDAILMEYTPNDNEVRSDAV